VTDLGNSVFKIQWGDVSAAAGYLIVDPELQAVLADSAPKEWIEVPDPPRYEDLELE